MLLNNPIHNAIKGVKDNPKIQKFLAPSMLPPQVLSAGALPCYVQHHWAQLTNYVTVFQNVPRLTSWRTGWEVAQRDQKTVAKLKTIRNLILTTMWPNQSNIRVLDP